jgi:tripartite-type tricarboxylate transporter receptor subunit TctC
VHVPYKGGPDAMNDVMMGRVTYWIGSVSTMLPLIQAGKLLALGIASRQRCALLPEVPTISEAGVAGFEAGIWLGVWAPAGTPADIVDKIAKDISRSLAKQDLQERFEKLAAEPMEMTPAEFARFVRSEVAVVSRLVKETGIKLN